MATSKPNARRARWHRRANSGIRSFYHAVAALAWFLHPLLFMLATRWVILILIRRDFFSRSLRLIAATPPLGVHNLAAVR